MHRSTGIPVELAAQELPAAPAPAGMIEVDDICDVDPLLRTGAFAANASQAPATDNPAGGPAVDDSVEIELSAEQIDALLSNPEAF